MIKLCYAIAFPSLAKPCVLAIPAHKIGLGKEDAGSDPPQDLLGQVKESLEIMGIPCCRQRHDLWSFRLNEIDDLERLRGLGSPIKRHLSREKTTP